MTIVIIGGSGRLGAHLIDRFNAEGRPVVATYHESAPASAPGCVLEQLDLRSDEQVEVFVERVEREHGPISALVNNAAVAEIALVALGATTHWRETHDVNLLGVVRACRSVARRMQRRSAGAIVNVVSAQAQRPAPGHAAYAASKAAVIALTRALASELAARAIRVNAVAPGYFPSKLNASSDPPTHARGLLGGETALEDAAKIIALLCTGLRSVSGQVFHVHSLP